MGCGGGGGLPFLFRLFLCGLLLLLLLFCDRFQCEFWSSLAMGVSEVWSAGTAGSDSGGVAATAIEALPSTEVDILVPLRQCSISLLKYKTRQDKTRQRVIDE